MDLATDFTVEDTFLIQGKGVVVTGNSGTESSRFQMGRTVKVTRPDGTYLTSTICGVEIFRSCFGSGERKNVGLLLGEAITKEDVPRGSKISLVDELRN